jgi:hypothetical protein
MSLCSFLHRTLLTLLTLPAALALHAYTNERNNVIEEHHPIQFVRLFGGECIGGVAIL